MTVTECLDILLNRTPHVADVDDLDGPYLVTCYNELDAGFGYDVGPQPIYFNLPRSVAKSIARHKNKTTPYFVSYNITPEPDRYW